MAITDPDRLQFDRLAMISTTDELTDAETEDLEALRAAHPTWVPGQAPESALPLERREERLTATELAEIAKSQGCSVGDLRHRWIIQYANSYYVVGLQGEYRPAIIKAALATSLPRDLARVPSHNPTEGPAPDGAIEWRKIKGDGTVPKTVDELLYEYSTVARKVVASMSIERSYYDPVAETFWEHTCPLRRDIQPAYHPEVDKWLTLLGGEESERLKDWIACATLLDHPICAIYIVGVKDAGKNLLAMGLSRLWGEAPTELESAHGAFNSAITDNPLIFADEELPRDMTSGFFRKFIAQGSHPLRRKNQAEAKLLGYFRVIIAANNPDLLKFDQEDFSPDDIAAIAARIMYIRATQEAADYLRELGGRNGTADWVEGDKIAAHALWLRDHRTVTRNSRFLVQGKPTDVHRRIATHGSIRGLVIEWICKAMLDVPRPFQLKKGKPEIGITFGSGHVYVNTGFVRSTWESVMGDARAPSLHKLGRALKPLAVLDRNGKPERRLPFGDRWADFYNIDPRHVYDAVQSLQIGTRDEFEKMIEGSSPGAGSPGSPPSTPDSGAAAPAKPNGANGTNGAAHHSSIIYPTQNNGFFDLIGK